MREGLVFGLPAHIVRIAPRRRRRRRTTWVVGNVAVVCSGGGVRGVGPIADALRTDIADRAWVSFGPEPDCRARLVPWNDQLLHWLVVAHAHGERLQVKTHYRPRIGRLPPMLRRILCGVIAATAANQREHIVF